MIDSAPRPNDDGTASVPYRRVEAAGRPVHPHRASFGPFAEVIGRVAETDVTVLLRGERGTGKERVARAIHSASPRRAHPFVKIDCAAPFEVLEPELFGCERGAFAGAGHHRPGRLEFAHHGTLFLDHVSELPAELQLRLLRLLEEGGFARVGAGDAVRANVRVIASSARDLERAVAEGQFREALFFRLNVLCLTLAPLRQRRAELQELVDLFVRQYASHYNKPEVRLSHETFLLFAEYRWPDNLQELEAVVKRIVLLGDDRRVREELARSMREVSAQSASEQPPGGHRARRDDEPLAAPATAAPAGKVPLKEIARQAADGAERELIFKTLQQTRWNRREAAQMLGVSYKALLYKIKRAEPQGAS